MVISPYSLHDRLPRHRCPPCAVQYSVAITAIASGAVSSWSGSEKTDQSFEGWLCGRVAFCQPCLSLRRVHQAPGVPRGPADAQNTVRSTLRLPIMMISLKRPVMHSPPSASVPPLSAVTRQGRDVGGQGEGAGDHERDRAGAPARSMDIVSDRCRRWSLRWLSGLVGQK